MAAPAQFRPTSWDVEPEINITVPREGWFANVASFRPAHACSRPQKTAISTVCVVGEQLIPEALPEPRSRRAIEIIESDFGEFVRSPEVAIVPIEPRPAERRASPSETGTAALAGLDEATERRLLEAFLIDRMRRSVDDLLPQLDGLTARQAAAGSRRNDVARLVRGIEHGDRTQRRGEPSANLAWLRRELGMEDQLAA